MRCKFGMSKKFDHALRWTSDHCPLAFFLVPVGLYAIWIPAARVGLALILTLLGASIFNSLWTRPKSKKQNH